MNNIEAKEKFSFNLLQPESKACSTTILYMVYKTIELNRGISLNKLKWLLSSEFMLQSAPVDGAVASLTSKPLFNCVSRWQPPGNAEHVHLRCRNNAEFSKWLEKALNEYPELSIFVAPDYAAISSKTTSKQ